MKVVHTIERFDADEIIRRNFSGTVTTEDIMDSFVYILNNGLISDRCKGILTDLREATLDFKMHDFNNLIVYLKSNVTLMNLRIAVVVNSSEKIVFPMMASHDSDILVQPFSTVEGAKRWIIQ